MSQDEPALNPLQATTKLPIASAAITAPYWSPAVVVLTRNSGPSDPNASSIRGSRGSAPQAGAAAYLARRVRRREPLFSFFEVMTGAPSPQRFIQDGAQAPSEQRLFVVRVNQVEQADGRGIGGGRGLA